jgi:hypothetical protein
MARNFYNLPSPWDPGYAIPGNVQDEGLQRHAYVTKMAARGTYDRSTDGSAGYAIPQYVLEERTGRGTYNTRWLPRGYYGPQIPNYLNRHPQPNITSMGDIIEYGPIASGTAVDQYGKKAARVILSNLTRVAPRSRPALLKKVMDQIDPSLHARVTTATNQAVKRGVPPAKALEAGLAHAMSSGFLNELARFGKSRQLPQARSLLGLGIYGGQEALGAIKTVTVFGVQPGQMRPDGTYEPPAGYTWNAQTGALQHVYPPGSAIVGCPGPCGVDVRDHRGTGAHMQIGPWAFPVQTATGTRKDPTSPVITSVLFKNDNGTISKDGQVSIHENEMSDDEFKTFVNGLWTALRHAGGQQMDAQPLFSRSMTSMALIRAGNNSHAVFPAGFTSIIGGKIPIWQFTHPGDGKTWGLYINYKGTNPTGVAATPSTAIWELTLHEKGWDGNILGSIWDGLEWLGAELVDVVVDIADAISDLACAAVHTPGAAAGAAAANPAAGVGVIAAAGLCGPGKPPIIPPIQMPSIMMPLLLGGAALFVIAFATKKKKKATP